MGYPVSVEDIHIWHRSPPPGPTRSPLRIVQVVLTVSALATVSLSGCAPALPSAGSGTNPLSAIFRTSKVTMENYTRLMTGMSYAQVVEILGAPGTELSRSSLGGVTTELYQWEGTGSLGANMNAMFQNDRLISKAQFGLR